MKRLRFSGTSTLSSSATNFGSAETSEPFSTLTATSSSPWLKSSSVLVAFTSAPSTDFTSFASEALSLEAGASLLPSSSEASLSKKPFDSPLSPLTKSCAGADLVTLVTLEVSTEGVKLTFIHSSLALITANLCRSRRE